jgi:hypothetical protein
MHCVVELRMQRTFEGISGNCIAILTKRPGDVSPHERLIMKCERVAQDRNGPIVIRVSERDGRIARKSPALGSEHRRATVCLSKFLFRHAQQPIQLRRQTANRHRLELTIEDFLGGLRIRADFLTFVTTEDPIAKLPAKLDRYRLALFDRLK